MELKFFDRNALKIHHAPVLGRFLKLNAFKLRLLRNEALNGRILFRNFYFFSRVLLLPDDRSLILRWELLKLQRTRRILKLAFLEN